MDDENKSSKEEDAKKEQAKNLVNDLIKSIRQSIKKEEDEKELSEKIGKFVLLQMGAIEIDGQLKLIV
jgi:nucleoid DNA-binding protein